jgi:hypothetical protein
MKKVILLLIFLPYQATAQIFENFEAGDLQNWISDNPTHWSADNIESLQGSYSLHHSFDNPDNGTDRVGIPLGHIHPGEGEIHWKFMIRHGYDPSSSNNWAAFLMSDVQPGNFSFSEVNGFAIGVNITGSDDSLRLVKIKDSSIKTVLTCKLNWQTDIGMLKPAIIDVNRTPEGLWSVKISLKNSQVLDSISISDNELFASNYFGFLYRYSSTKDRLLWIDDVKISGVFYVDNSAPSLASVVVAGKKSVRICFNEHPADSLLVPSNFELPSGNANVTGLHILNPLTLILDLDSELRNKTKNSIIIKKICDESGNCSEMLSADFYPAWAETGDIIISEILVDPSPQVSLPESEFIEITNRTTFDFNLNKWRLNNGSKYFDFPKTDINKGEVLIMCKDADTALFRQFGKVKGLVHFPLLNLEGRLTLSDSSGQLIHYLDYDKTSYGSTLKSEGGWSLEMIDTQFPFNTDKNWTGSRGSPGKINLSASANEDLLFSGLRNVFPVDSFTLFVSFSEPVFDFETIKNSVITENEITDVKPSDLICSQFLLRLSHPLKRKESFDICIPDLLKDFAGNIIQKKKQIFGLPERPLSGDLSFNEIMFHPLPGDPDYIELYNCSDKVIDAARLFLVSVNDETSDTSELFQASIEPRCIMPGSYYSITTDRDRVIERYPENDQDLLFALKDLPSMSDDKGHLLLLSRELGKIDELRYDDKMHYSLLSGHEGIALEKILSCTSSMDVLSWHSASQNSGWGTPGKLNSLSDSAPESSDMISLSSTRITPDYDGNDDMLTIGLNLNGNGNVVSITVYDEAGNSVKRLVSGMLCGSESAFIWDATADDGTQVRSGIYVIYITIFDDTGKTGKWKKACTVLRKR